MEMYNFINMGTIIIFTIDTLFACTCIYLEEVLKGQCKGRPRNFKMRKGGLGGMRVQKDDQKNEL